MDIVKDQSIFGGSFEIFTVNPQKRHVGLILPLMVQMRVLLEFGPNLGVFAYCFSSFLRVLLECGSYLRAGLFQGFTVCIVQ